MGLDNGIRIKNKTKKQLSFWPFHFPFDWESDDGDTDLCYWRKCWGLREDVLRILGMEEYPDEYEFTLTWKDVRKIRRLIEGYLKHPDRWDRSIWEFEDMKDCLHEDWRNLIFLEYWMRSHPKETVYFYDSY